MNYRKLTMERLQDRVLLTADLIDFSSESDLGFSPLAVEADAAVVSSYPDAGFDDGGNRWEVEGYTDGNIDLTVEGNFAFDESGGDDHGDNAGTATQLSAGGGVIPLTFTSAMGNIEVGGDTDWFRFTSVAGAEYVFKTELGTLNDTVLSLYDSNGMTLLLLDDDNGAGLASYIEWTAPGDATYFLQVAAFSSFQAGTYTLHVDASYAGPANDLV